MDETGIIEPLILQDGNLKGTSQKYMGNYNCRAFHEKRVNVHINPGCMSHLVDHAVQETNLCS